MLGTSDPWSTSHLSKQTTKPGYYIVDCQISRRCKKRCAKNCAINAKNKNVQKQKKKIHSFPQEWIPQIFISSHMTYDATLYLFQMPLNVQASIFWIIHKLHHCGKIGSSGLRDVNSLTSQTRLNIFPHDGTQVNTQS